MSPIPQDRSTTMLEEMIANWRTKIDTLNGTERAFAYTSWSLLKEGYYSPDELIDLALQGNFTLDNPIAKIRRGTEIGERVVIRNGTVIEGQRIKIGTGTVLDNAQMYGNDNTIGENNFLSGAILPDHMSLGVSNEVRGIAGKNEGMLIIGNYNKINEISISNHTQRQIVIGDYNELHQGLSFNCVFPQGNIRIGNHNSLGRDGGGVISTAYRFNRGWWGDVLIGSHVETTRGAEILGFTLMGWPLSAEDEQVAQDLFPNGSISQIATFFQRLWQQEVKSTPQPKSISLFGTVKARLCCLTGTVKVKDDTRIQRSFLKNFYVAERSKIYFTLVNAPSLLYVTLQDRAIEHLTITEPIDWAKLPTEDLTDGYCEDDTLFYEEHT